MALNASCVPMLMLDIALHPRYASHSVPIPGFSPAQASFPAHQYCTRRRHRSCGDCHLPEAGLSCSSRRNVMLSSRWLFTIGSYENSDE